MPAEDDGGRDRRAIFAAMFELINKAADTAQQRVASFVFAVQIDSGDRSRFGIEPDFLNGCR